MVSYAISLMLDMHPVMVPLHVYRCLYVIPAAVVLLATPLMHVISDYLFSMGTRYIYMICLVALVDIHAIGISVLLFLLPLLNSGSLALFIQEVDHPICRYQGSSHVIRACL